MILEHEPAKRINMVRGGTRRREGLFIRQKQQKCALWNFFYLNRTKIDP